MRSVRTRTRYTVDGHALRASSPTSGAVSDRRNVDVCRCLTGSMNVWTQAHATVFGSTSYYSLWPRQMCGEPFVAYNVDRQH